MAMIKRGRCWKFGDNVHCDGDMIPVRFALSRETDPQLLKDHLFSGIDPAIAARLAPDDIVVAGRNFGCGHPHPQAMFALVGARMGVVSETMPRGAYRNMVIAGVPFIPHCPGVTEACDDGDEIEVDFSTGRFSNLTTGRTIDYKPLDARLLETIALGGWRPMVLRRIEQKRAEAAASAR